MTIKFRSVLYKLEQIRQKLIEELDQVKADSGFVIEQHEIDPSRGRDAAAVATTDFERRIALEGQKRKSLADIEKAIQKLDAGTYGICDNCGQAIDPARLEALPQAIYCMKCSTCKK